MARFLNANPIRQTIRDHYNVYRDPIISRLLAKTDEVVREGLNVFDYFKGGPAFLHDEEGLEDLIGGWIADHLYGQGDIQIDPASLGLQLEKLKANAGEVPDLDAITDLYVWAWWRVQYLYALIHNQRRGVPLGSALAPAELPYAEVDSPAMPLHLVRRTPRQECPTNLTAELAEIVSTVEEAIQSPAWIPGDAKRLRDWIAAHYCRWIDWLSEAGVRVAFDACSLAAALDLLRLPAKALPGYVGPQYRYGVSFPAGAFLVAQALALDALAPKDVPIPDYDYDYGC